MKNKLHYKTLVLLFLTIKYLFIKLMAKLRKTLILRISEKHLKYIINETINSQKTKSRIIREAIEKHIVNEKNR